MAAATDRFSAPGSVSYDADTMVVGDGTWDFSRNTFLLPNLESPNFDTMRYNGMGNRFSTFTEYHRLIIAHGVLAAMAFLFLLPFSIMTARFYTTRPGMSIKYHAQLNIFAGLLVLAVFILGFFAVGPERHLTNPHHGIGVTIFVMLVLQLVGGRLIRHITKDRSLRIMIHQWSGRTIALLGITQVPLGLTLYGSPDYLFILYAIWMAFLLLLYFILSWRSPTRRELYRTGAGHSEAGRTRVTESEFYESGHRSEGGGTRRWLGPLAAGAGVWALMRGRNKDRARAGSRSRSRSRTRGPEVVASRRGSASYIDEEKYSELPRQRQSGGGGFGRTLGGVAAAVGAGKLFSNWRNRRDTRRDEEYSAISTETPRRHRPTRGAMTASEYGTEMTPNIGPDDTATSLLPPSANPPVMAAAMSAANPRLGSQPPVTPRATRPYRPTDTFVEESEYSSYVSPSRRPADERPRGGPGRGILASLGLGRLAKGFAGWRARREEERYRDEEDLRSGTQASRYTGDSYMSPTRRTSQRPPPAGRRPGQARQDSVLSEMTESSIETRPVGGTYGARSSTRMTSMPSAISPVPVTGRHSRSQSGSRRTVEHVAMPPMPPDPHGVLHSEAEGSRVSAATERPQRRTSSRRRHEGQAAAEVAAARAESLAADEDRVNRVERERYGSPQSQPVSLKLKVHDDRDRNVTLRRLTEEEAMAERNRADSETSLSGVDSPSNRRRYRRDVSRRRAESAAGRPVEQDELAPLPLSPPDPAFARGRRAGKDSAYYSGQPGPSGGTPAAGQTVSSLASPESHGTWSAMSPSPGGPAETAGSAAADNRRRRRLERRRGSSSRPAGTGADMFD
ncbi:hypothetical protein S7711_04049 [Stachybotrys chartarum IBT 7711]|uniref:Cytochrome b561 domain-containing protein n=1 Tax=Stachybotrys chartarum (strain CBS 109288 / IBT 7711) TaxID=1280523 RepID=A0A084AXK5_STACB|nr:hypothetical protein S7711_04049 [Stachybotrys chartarum IBT 7711]KFA50741.1 hypothetical protein S40293_06076 [Stachybotrys chartarum IBT 40293]